MRSEEQTLLAIATMLLGSMTGSRYGFSWEFEIVDRLTGLSRSAKSLSGEGDLPGPAQPGRRPGPGRTGRARRRPTGCSLVLDEGFGALDANAPSEALDALDRQAETGRLVAVISHFRSVAEAMDRALAVTFGPSGSQAHWLSGDEHDKLIAEDVGASLLT